MFDSWQGQKLSYFPADSVVHPASFFIGVVEYFLEGKAAET